MKISSIREKLHQLIDDMEDKKAKAMYALFADEIEDDGEYTDEFKAELDKRHEYYEKGGKMISAEEANEQIQTLLKSFK